MNFFAKIIMNEAIIIAFVAWFIAQMLKVVLTLLLDKRFDLSRFVGSGGMPSSHTSTVMGLSTAVGLRTGWDSPIYAIAITFALVVMYDASGVRRAVGKQAALLNKMIVELSQHKQIKNEELKELIGHTPFEVIAGAVLGVIVANVMIV